VSDIALYSKFASLSLRNSLHVLFFKKKSRVVARKLERQVCKTVLPTQRFKSEVRQQHIDFDDDANLAVTHNERAML
jgi:hypothetical protein